MLIDRKTIAQKLAVTQRTLREAIEPLPGFPKPAIYVSQKTIRWREDEIDAFIERQNTRIYAVLAAPWGIGVLLANRARYLTRLTTSRRPGRTR